ncbi:hypothetical protein WJX75_005857 [Coccomyxa subellipsoidea]|uniref:Uncharacterized protein n=1 Tax=Coccomyxa subellipsoidea TaxID=248742 RepID=A0ABR2YAZ5_9CHLO
MPGHHFKVSAVLPIAASDYFIERDSAAFRSLVSKSMKVGALDIVDGWMEGESEVYKFVTKLEVDNYVPKSLQRHFSKEGLHYTDIITYDPKLIARAPYRLPVKSIAPILPEKSRIECMLTIAEEEPGVSCRQTLEGEVEFKLMGLGHLAARIVADNLEKVYQGMPLVVQRWVDFRNEVLQQEGGRDILFSGRPDNHGIDWISKRITTMVQAPYSTQPPEGSDRLTNLGSSVNEPGSSAAREGTEALPDQATASKSAEAKPGDAAPDAAHEIASGQMPAAAAARGDGEGDVYYDALDDWAWAEEEAMIENCAATKAAVKTDHAAAVVWIRHASQKNIDMLPIDIGAAADRSQPSTTPDEPHADSSHKHRTFVGERFSKTFHRNQAAWDKFWDHHQVPVLHAVPNLAARLSHLLRLAVAWGLIRERSSSTTSDSTGSAGALSRASQGSTPQAASEEQGRQPEWWGAYVLWFPRSIDRTLQAGAGRIGHMVKQCSPGRHEEEKQP